MDVSDEGSFK